MLAYVQDDAVRRQWNARRMNYWDAYIAEVLEMLGLRGRAVSAASLEKTATLSKVQTLLIGSRSGAALSEKARAAVARWVRRGGTLIGFGFDGLDEVFGLEPAVKTVRYGSSYPSLTRIEQGFDDWAINGSFNLRSHDLTREVHPLLFIQHKLPIVSDILLKRLGTAEELASLFDTSGKMICMPAITWNAFGRGRAGYFAFDLPKTVWLIRQGRPAPDHPEDDRNPRTHEMSILGGLSRLVPYADAMCWIVQNMIAHRPHPFICQPPPKDGRPSDACLYYGGDEYHGPVELSIKAAEFMHGLGLPYQTNIESDRHPMTQEQHAYIRSLGTEVSAYYHLYEDDGFTMNAEHFRFQSDRFLERFGYRPVAVVVHNIRWKGWTEPAKWMRAAGTRAVNGFPGRAVPNDNHFRNSASYGFGFGTAFPFYFRDDWQSGNARIDFMAQPIVGYELGHRGSTSVRRDMDTFAPDDLHLALDAAIKYHQVANLFYHPHYLVHHPNCQAALREVLRYIAYRGATVVHMNNRQVAEWWDARHASGLAVEKATASALTFRADCRYPGGMTVKVPLPAGRTARIRLDGRAVAAAIQREFARDWASVVVPKGRHRVEVKLARLLSAV